MHYSNLFIQRRKTEPKFVFVLRGCIMMLLIAFIVVYTIFLIIDVIDSARAPVIQISDEFVNEIPFPGMFI